MSSTKFDWEISISIKGHNPERVPYIKEALGNTIFAKAGPGWLSRRNAGRIIIANMDMNCTEEEEVELSGVAPKWLNHAYEDIETFVHGLAFILTELIGKADDSFGITLDLVVRQIEYLNEIKINLTL